MIYIFFSGYEFFNLTAGGRGDRESACAGLINQLQCCQFDPRNACMEDTDTAIVGDCGRGWGDTTPCTVKWCKNVPSRKVGRKMSPICAVSTTILSLTSGLYPEWLHRQGGGLACCGCTFESAKVALIYTMHVALRGYCP